MLVILKLPSFLFRDQVSLLHMILTSFKKKWWLSSKSNITIMFCSYMNLSIPSPQKNLKNENNNIGWDCACSESRAIQKWCGLAVTTISIFCCYTLPQRSQRRVRIWGPFDKRVLQVETFRTRKTFRKLVQMSENPIAIETSFLKTFLKNTFL
jgi:hypothetical protein